MTEINIIRRKHNSNFSIVPNRIFDDPGMTVTAGYVLLYLLSRPDDWKVHTQQIAAKFGLSKRTVQRELKLLIHLGYVTRELKRNDKTRRYAGASYTVYDDPEGQKDNPPPAQTDSAGLAQDETQEPRAKIDTPVFCGEMSRAPNSGSRLLSLLLSTERDQFLTEGNSEAIASAGAGAPPQGEM